MSGYDPYNSSRVRMEQERLNPSRFDHKAAESQWRGMESTHRQAFNKKAPTPKRFISVKTVLMIMAIAIAGAALYSTMQCQPEVRCAD